MVNTGKRVYDSIADRGVGRLNIDMPKGCAWPGLGSAHIAVEVKVQLKEEL